MPEDGRVQEKERKSEKKAGHSLDIESENAPFSDNVDLAQCHTRRFRFDTQRHHTHQRVSGCLQT